MLDIPLTYAIFKPLLSVQIPLLPRNIAALVICHFKLNLASPTEKERNTEQVGILRYAIKRKRENEKYSKKENSETKKED